ncbi:keywimysin-related RiPP [Kibdelosporangium aridum]|uniref:keywimysin-related RiPP n=1 Tax=Kibdelosporangium aridum TaxID=2030 RepID=UPI0035E703B2
MPTVCGAGYGCARTRIDAVKGGASIRTYERPTLMRMGSFARLTGLGGRGPRDLLFRHQLL